MKALKTNWNRYLACLGSLFSLAILTFVIPLVQLLTDRLGKSKGVGTLLGNALIILVLGCWSARNRLLDYYPSSPLGRAVYYLMGISMLILLILNVQSQPASGITGQARSPCEVINVVVLGSAAEELVFRGAMWSLFQQLARGGNENRKALAGTSILFGVEHLGYWAQSTWPLPMDAYIHSISMVVAGLFFGILRLKTESLPIPMFVHVLANGFIVSFQ